ncbi:MAG: helix-turn-helix transcriptional regulator [Amphritea sp.]|jgi:transcriptional regulator with XRE-family HTH domain|nr:helix-turn-helix transcriptional regulator [Amphritea sp.]
MSRRKEIGKQLSKARKEKGITQKQIHESTDLDQAVISKIENGRFNGSLRIFEEYLSALDFDLAITPKKRVLPRFNEVKGRYDDE